MNKVRQAGVESFFMIPASLQLVIGERIEDCSSMRFVALAKQTSKEYRQIRC